MNDAPTLLYLEADDEITTVVRRLRAADAGRVVIVAPGRSRATASAVALRLLARAGEEQGRELVIVGDGLTRSLAAEAGLPAFASVEDARAAPDEVAAAVPAPHHASIHVVRGPASDDTAPTMAVAPVVSAETETRPVPVARAPRLAPGPRPVRRAVRVGPLVPLLLTAAAVLAVVAFVGATVLPAATIRIVARTVDIGPVPYEITIEDPDRASGTVEADATVTATGTYTTEEAASGTVVLYNWTFFPVSVPAGTFVAAGEQAFATQADVVVPRGRLTIDGRIGAGDVSVAVVAAAPGPAANVDAEAIDTVVSSEIDQQLRGFPENPEPRVLNPEPTSGGADASGPEFTQADIDEAVAALRADLDARVADELAGTDDGLFVDRPEPAEPSISIPEGLAGTRDQAEATISGELGYDRIMAEPADVVSRAEERFASDAALVPDDHELLTEGIEVTVGEVRREEGALIVAVTVVGRATAVVDRAEVLRRVAGRSEDEAEAALADIGAASVDLWPGWVTTVPDSEWRIDVQEAAADPDPSVP